MGQRRPDRPAGNLPGSFTSFVGRRRELAEVRSRLEQSRLVTLTGVGGVGKTRLAIEAATLARRGFRDGTWFADLAAVTDPEHVPQAVASALSVPDQSTRPAAEQLAAHLAERELLLVLDNCEHQLDACAPLAEHLLRSAPQLRLLITSREALGLVGEHLVLVPPLRLPAGGRLPPLDSLTQYDAITMLRDRAAAVAPGFAITAGNHQAVVRLCAELDGLPLGIELAASRLRTMPIEQLVERLGDRFRLLTGGSRAALPRQRTLRALVDWSFELCSPPERLLWTRASVFAGSFTLAAAEGVCSGDGLEEAAVLDLLAHLVVQSVLLVDDGPGGPRYRMLETIRQYGRDRLDERGETALLRRRHRDHYLGLAEQQAAAWPGPGQEAGLAALRAEHSNLRVALDWSIRSGDCASAQRLVAALRFHWCADGFLSEGRRWLDQALLLDDTPTSARAQALWAAAWAALLQGDHTAAAERLTECARIAEMLDDPVAAAYVTSLHATSALFRGRLDDAVAQFRRAVERLRSVGDSAGVLLSLFQLAMAQAHRHDDTAAATGKQAVAISEEHGEHWCRSYALWALGFDAWLRGDVTEAFAHTRAGLLLQRGFDDPVGAALMIELMAWVSATREEHTRAGRLLGAARSIWRTIGTSISAFGPHLAHHHAECERTILEAVRADRLDRLIAEGTSWDHREAIARALGETRASEPAAYDESGAYEQPPAPLTKRELQVAGLIAEGMSNRQIANSLTLSTRTVDGHVEHILTKLAFTSRSQVAAWVSERKAATAPT